MDEEYGFQGIEAKNPNAGLILSYEKTGYDVNTPGRLPELLPNESLQRLVQKGADAAKVLVYYNPDEPQEILDTKHAFLERLGTKHKQPISQFLSNQSSTTMKSPTINHRFR